MKNLEQAKLEFQQAQTELAHAWARGDAREMVAAKHNLNRKLQAVGRLVKEQIK